MKCGAHLLSFCLLLLSMSASAQDDVVAGVIRNAGDGWYVISDAAHQPLNIESVRSDDTSISVVFGTQFSAIRTFIVSSDETYAEQGVVCGASVALDLAIIKCSRGGQPVSPAHLMDKLGNLWLYGVFTR